MPGLTFREMAGADICCGSAGIYNVVQNEMSMQILAHKMESVNATQAQHHRHRESRLHAATAGGRPAARIGQRVMHVVEILDQSYTAYNARPTRL